MITVKHIHEMILRAGDRQIATAAVAKPILAHGLSNELRELVAQISGQVANALAFDVEVEIAVARGKMEIRQDIEDGFLPPSVTCFADLHSHTDANLYGFDSDGGEPECEVVKAAHDRLDAWLRSGRVSK